MPKSRVCPSRRRAFATSKHSRGARLAWRRKKQQALLELGEPLDAGKAVQAKAKAESEGSEMTLSSTGQEDLNGGPSETKRLCLDNKEQFIVCDCDILATVDKVIDGFTLEEAWKGESTRFSKQSAIIDSLEREFLEIDIAFDKMEHDIAKLKDKKSKDQAAALAIPEIHFFDVFVKTDNNFKMPESPKKAPPTPVTKPVPPVTVRKPTDEVIPVGGFTHKVPNLPPEGPVVRKELEISSKILATRNYPLGVFFKARVIQIQQPAKGDEDGEIGYRVKFDARKTTNGSRASKWFTARELAYAERPSVILPVGTRVVATYSDESWTPRQSLYAGLIAEPPKPLNRYRYLVFFDDGYAQYVAHDRVFLMCGTSKAGVWEDMYRDVRDFVRGYLGKYPERPMLRMRRGQTVKTEWNGKWWMAKVLAVDSSLVKMSFESDKRTEWIYRGSTRFAPLYTALHTTQTQATGGRVRRQNLVPATGKKQHQPFVQYTRNLDDTPDDDDDDDNDDNGAQGKKSAAALRNVARKSTTQGKKRVSGDEDKEGGKEVLLSQAGTREVLQLPKSESYKRLVCKPHTCSSECTVEPWDPSEYLGKNPLSIPCLLGWERQVVKQSKRSKRRVFYKAPCGRRLRNIAELACYLRLCDSPLTVDQFCFDSYVNVFSQFVPQKVVSSIRDLTYGKEQVPVSCINSLNKEFPPYVEYSSTRYPGKGVELNLDKEFLCGCDCKDDCQDREKCSCQQLTVSATEALPSGRNPNAGYHYRRLPEPLITGIYECNAQCHCSRRCLNRVAQNGLTSRLQVFMTEKCGWGIRCLDDLPQGSFVCVYAGQLLTEQGANEDGNQYGDEYLAELDHIEVVEKQKEGYESDVVEPSEGDEDEEEEQDTGAISDSDDNSVDESDLQEGASDSDGEAETSAPGDLPAKRSTRIRKKRESPQYDDLMGIKRKSEDEGMVTGKSKSDGGPAVQEGTDEESSESKSTEDKSADQTGDESQSSTKFETAKKTVKTKKISKAGGDKGEGKGGDSKAKSGPLDRPDDAEKSSKFPPTRSFFNEEFCYIMDAKNCGNIGRYLNHSCSPNVYVQNVFVDSHDLRFPWVAFFAARFIRAGVELTWDYNYDVGSVPERVMYCQCGADECRGRLI